MKKLVYLLLAIVLLSSVLGLVACGGGDDNNKTSEPQSTQENKLTPTAVEPTQTPKAATATPKPTETTKPTATAKPVETAKPTISGMGELGDVVSMDELDSYKMHMVMSSGVSGNTVTDMEVINNPPPKASHTVSGAGLGGTEVITIGDKTWVKMGNQGWMESTSSQSSVQEPTDITDYLNNTDTHVDYQGKEKVNGVNCKHYNVDMDMTIKNPNPEGGAPAEYNAHFTGEIWVADESSLPKVMIRQKGTMTAEMPQPMGKVVMDTVVDITNVNDGSISISQPPADQIIQVPGGGNMGNVTPGAQPSGVPCSQFTTGSQEWLDCMKSWAQNQSQ